MPIAAVAMRRFWAFTHKIYHKQWEADSKASSVLFDIFSGIRVVKSYGTEDKEYRRYERAIHKEMELQIKNETLYCLIHPFLGFILQIGSFFLLYYTASHMLDQTMTYGEASKFVSYVSYIYGPIGWLAGLPRILTRTYTSLVKLFDVLFYWSTFRRHYPKRRFGTSGSHFRHHFRTLLHYRLWFYPCRKKWRNEHHAGSMDEYIGSGSYWNIFHLQIQQGLRGLQSGSILELLPLDIRVAFVTPYLQERSDYQRPYIY